MEGQEKNENRSYTGELVDEHPFRNNKFLKFFILALTIAVFIIPIFVLLNLLNGKPPFMFF